MEQPFRHILLIGERRTEAVAPDVDQEVGSLAGAERVAVDADDAGHRAAVGIERRRAVVGLDLVDQVDLVVEVDHAGVVAEDRDQPVHLVGDFAGALLNEGLVAGDDLLLFAVFEIFVVDLRAENLMFAVFAPGLSEHFELDVGRIVPEAVFLTILRLTEIALNRLHLLQRQRENSLAADLQKLIVGNLQIVFANFAALTAVDHRQVERNSIRRLFAGEHQHRLDQLVGKQF